MPRVTEIGPYEDELGNRIIGSPSKTMPGSSINFNSTNCVIRFEQGVTWSGGVQFHQPNGRISIGQRSCFRGAIAVGRDCTVTIGELLSVTSNLEIVTEDGVSVDIGDDCLFAKNVALRAYDNHPIYDLESGERINFSRPIKIGDHVWIGAGATVMGGSTIGGGAIIGTMSVVTASHPIDVHALAVGVPATVRRRGVAWVKPGNPPAPTLPHRESYPRFI
ncbi:acyltransferase [Luteococcus sp. Sow4_B9]|uniref:acyltransferase n=1 Tax=Luteococcus sp. Sow4_B9 TaxID=3438792 RepID=UPI003F944AF4